MLSPSRSSPGASTHLPRPRPPPLVLSSLPHHRPPPRHLALSLVLLPPGRAGVGGAAAEDAVGGSWGSWDAQAPTPALAPLPGGAP
jgi:hypothetical protein